MLTELVGIVQRRNGASDRRAPGYKHGGLLILLDEWQDVRSAAVGKVGERIDVLLGRIVRMGRAVGAHVVVATQRPSVDDVPSGVRNLLSQRLAGVIRNAADAALVLGEAPALSLPTKPGEFLVATPTGTVAATLDFLDQKDWETVCARAAALRAPKATPATTDAQNGSESPEKLSQSDPAVTAPVMPLDPTLSAVLEVLADGPPQGMTAAAVLAALPDHLQPIPPSVLAMGKAFGKWAKANDPLVRQNRTPTARLWQPVTPVMDPSSTRQDPSSGGGFPPPDPSVTLNDAQNGPQTPENGAPDAQVSLPVISPAEEGQQ